MSANGADPNGVCGFGAKIIRCNPKWGCAFRKGRIGERRRSREVSGQQESLGQKPNTPNGPTEIALRLFVIVLGEECRLATCKLNAIGLEDSVGLTRRGEVVANS